MKIEMSRIVILILAHLGKSSDTMGMLGHFRHQLILIDSIY